MPDDIQEVDCPCQQVDAGDECEESYGGWFCTLAKGHKGKHKACTPNDHGIVEWKS